MKLTFLSITSCNACGTDANDSTIIGARLNKQQGWNPWKRCGISTNTAKCNKCGLIYANPLPLFDSIEETYNVDPGDYWGLDNLKYDENSTCFAKEAKKSLVLLNATENCNSELRALDIGAGPGKAMRTLMAYGFSTDGIEPISQFWNIAVNINKIPKERIANVSIENAVLPQDFYDFITFGAVLEHLRDPYQALYKARQALRPGGIIHAEVPNTEWLIAKIVDAIYRSKLTHYTTHLSPLHPPFHLYEFSGRSIYALANRLQLKIASIEYMVCGQSPDIPKLIQKVLASIMKSTNSGMQISVFVQKR